MRSNLRRLQRHLLWLILLFLLCGFFVLLLWIADVQAFRALSAAMVLASLLGFVAISSVLLSLEYRREKAFLTFLDSPDEYHEELLIKSAGVSRAQLVRLLGTVLREKQGANDRLKVQMEEYEEYVESWAHEIKVPLSLLTLLLDNRREELPEKVRFKLDYIQTCMQEYIAQMLYYARIKGARKDYLFEQIDIGFCVEEVLEDYRPLLEEKGFLIITADLEGFVYTDRRGLRFLIEQVVSNAIKYSDKKQYGGQACDRYGYKKDEALLLSCSFSKKEQGSVLSIRDNGIGVKSCDLPYIFEKGFTGDSGENRKRATGMGLYLAKEVAQELGLSLEAFSEWGEGFEMQIRFPVVDEKEQEWKKETGR